MLTSLLSHYKIVAVFAIAMLATGCVFTVTFPAAMQTTSQDFSIDAGNHLVISVKFSEDVDMSTLVPQTNVILVTEKIANAPITIAAGNSADEIIITSVDVVGDLLIFDADGFFSLQIGSVGGDTIRSTSGAVLDGDADGLPGGDYTTQFVLLG